MTTGFHVTRDGSVMVLTIDRQRVRNALDPLTRDGIVTALEGADRDQQMGAAVLTGAGELSFSPGMDLKALAATRPTPRVRRARSARCCVRPIGSRSSPPSEATRSVAGSSWRSCATLVVAADDVVFGLPEVGRGLESTGANNGTIPVERSGVIRCGRRGRSAVAAPFPGPALAVPPPAATITLSRSPRTQSVPHVLFGDLVRLDRAHPARRALGSY